MNAGSWDRVIAIYLYRQIIHVGLCQFVFNRLYSLVCSWEYFLKIFKMKTVVFLCNDVIRLSVTQQCFFSSVEMTQNKLNRHISSGKKGGGRGHASAPPTFSFLNLSVYRKLQFIGAASPSFTCLEVHDTVN